MKTKSLLVKILFGLCVFQACQNTDKKASEIQSATTDSTIDKNVITDTTAVNRGTDLSIFMNEAAISAMMEVALGKVAQEKTSNPKIKDFAKKMVKDHTKIGDNLKKLADDKKMALPVSITSADLAHISEMKKMSENDFDKHYMGMMVMDHIKTLDLFKSASVSGDTPLQDFAIKALHMLEDHYKTATAINDKLK